MSNTITITGQLGKQPELRFTPSGQAVLNGSVADTPRRYNRDTGQWEDAGDTLWLDWSIFGADAESLAETLTKGARVTVVGRLRARSFEHQGQRRTVNEITADSIAIHARKQGQQSSSHAGPAQQQDRGGDDPWRTPAQGRAPF